MNTLLKRFIRYVKISSPSGHEQKFAVLLKKELKQLGIKYKHDKMGNIVAHIKGTVKNAPTIMLNAHIDTVVHKGSIKPKICKGFVRSDGTTILGADDKAGVAVIMELLTTISKGDDSNRRLCGDLLIVLTVQEETGLQGASHLVKTRFIASDKADFGFALDGGSTNVILNGAPSQLNIQAEIVGKAAHAGSHPEDGISAIKVASQAIAGMKLGRIDHETTANIGIIKGGIATNIIPEKVKIKGEARSHDKKKLKQQIEHMKLEINKACKKNQARAKINVKEIYRSFRIPQNDKALLMVSSALKKLKLKPKIKPSGGGSDANIFNACGVKTLILGVGAHNLHTTNEHLNIKEMEQAFNLLMEVVSQNA